MYGAPMIIIIGSMLVDVYSIQILNILIYLMSLLKNQINMNHIKLIKLGQIIRNIFKKPTRP